MMRFAICMCMSLAVLAAFSQAQELPPDSEYVVVKDGHLYQDGQRVRFWGGIGSVPAGKAPGDDPYAFNRRAVDRIEAYGFNMMRIWGMNKAYEGQPDGYTKGDGSKLDLYDWFIAEAKRRGLKLWVGSAGDGGNATAQDVGIIDEPTTAQAWKDAVGEGINRVGFHMATAWDARLEAITIRNTQHMLDRVNQHTGLRLADDPVFAVWELTNEQWWIVKMVSGQWQKLPQYFRDSLIARWHEFLRAKYGTQEALVTKWGGLLPGEDLAKGTILLAPLRNAAKVGALNDSNANAEAKFEGVLMEFGRDDFSAHRARDVNEFFSSLILNSKRRQAEAFKNLGKSTRLGSLLWDTGIGYDGISQLIHQNADAVSHCAYIGGVTHDEANGRYPFFSGLEEPPRICLDVPWLENNKVEGKPFLCYEINIGSPAKFRTEFPYRVLFLATIQDWDIVCWHTLSGGYKWDRENPFDGPISSPGPAAVQFNFQHDEVLISAIRAAGAMFTGMSLAPAPKPTKFIFGRNTIFGPASMDYAGSYGKNGHDMLNTTYRYGTRIEIDLTRDDDEIIGRSVPQKTWAHPNPLKPTEQMTYDWRKGYLRIDSPSAAAYTGFLAQYGADSVEFANGVRISDVSVSNPPDAPYPITPEENYISVGITSTDGKPLAECKTAVISAVSTSNNKGLVVGRDPAAPDRPPHVWAGSKVMAGAWKTPVIVSRVNCTITAPALAGMTYQMRDWQWKIVGEGKVSPDGKVVISADVPVFVIELSR